MNIFRNMSDFFFKVVKGLGVLLFILFLGLIIKWKIDTLYLESIKQTEIKFSLIDEIKKTHSDIKNKLSSNPEETKSLAPVEEKISEDMVQVNIPKDPTPDMVANELIDKGFLTEKGEFLEEVDRMSLSKSFVSGSYEFHKNAQVKDLILKLTNTQEKVYEIEIVGNETPEEIGKKLQELGVIKSEKAFAEQVKTLQVENKFKAGKYKITTPIKVVHIIEDLTNMDLTNQSTSTAPQKTTEEKK